MKFSRKHIATVRETSPVNHEEFVLQNGASLNAKDQDKIIPIEQGLMRKQMTAFKTMIVYTEF